MFRSDGRRRSARGNILISVLWVIVILSILVMGLSYEARSDMERTRLMRDRAKAYWMARGAVERVKYDYAALRQSQDVNDVLVTRYSYTFDEGTAECEVISNSSSMSVNSRSRELWEQLLKFYVDEQEAVAITDAIMDWRDEDNLLQASGNGAETEYYMSLNPPYPARNGPFYSVEEIMLVRGITEEMYYGTSQKPGLNEILDLSRQSLTRFDINTAPKGILMAFLEMTPEEATDLVRARSEQYFGNVNEAAEVVNITNMENLTTYFMSFRGSTFTIKATAFVNEARYTVETQVNYRGGGAFYHNVAHKDFSLEHVDQMAIEEPEE